MCCTILFHIRLGLELVHKRRLLLKRFFLNIGESIIAAQLFVLILCYPTAAYRKSVLLWLGNSEATGSALKRIPRRRHRSIRTQKKCSSDTKL